MLLSQEGVRVLTLGRVVRQKVALLAGDGRARVGIADVLGLFKEVLACRLGAIDLILEDFFKFFPVLC